jgi:heavy metal sensor kinase
VSRSIRLTLLLWYAVILVMVIASFGAMLYHHRTRAVIEQIDGELKAHAVAIAGTLEFDAEEGLELEYAYQVVHRFDDGPPGEPYCRILDPEAGTLLCSAGAPEIADFPEPGFRGAGDRREFVAPGPQGTRVVVGVDTTAAKGDLARFRRTVFLAGAAALLLALLGGWFLVGRLLDPIRRMTEAAEAISSTDLSRRIDIGSTETELGRLAGTLNSAFDRLADAFDRQTRFTADASHELRTPVSIVVSNAECGLRRDRTSEEYRESLEHCLRAGRRMTGVVDGLLVLTRADAGELVLSREPVDLRALVSETVDFLRPLAGDHGVTVSLSADAEPAMLSGDAERLRTAVGNLVSNAIRYNRENGRVDVTLLREEGELVLIVSDTGVGIPEEARARVFERFFRVDRARSRDAGGSGLGLAITKLVVEAHGGRISLTSEEGAGTTVTVRLPGAP